MSVIVENVVVASSAWKEDDLQTLFENEIVHFTDETQIPNLLAELGIFVSTTQARKAGRTGEIPPGFTCEFKASKKHRLWIWNPTE